ncbi:GNAT family N-acetyltransferase [Falsibacillus albus]|uniref:N-acetyltransferase n=1 Tax=Falsibacillus albus TaxID=2478915 RepID=A0A3L7JK28_9BACI|nr:GNAT family protein [Falsibacillus albus]RLQ91083.1 N-acetyltransferase [Falsibacillus albus]
MDRVFQSFVDLDTEHLKLRQINMEDAPKMYANFSLDEVTKYYDLETFQSIEQAEQLIQKLLRGFAAGKQIRWAITIKPHHELIGTIGFHEIEREHRKAEIGYEIHPDFWGRGIVTEAIKEIVRFGFEEMDLNRMEAFYDPENIASQKVLHKNGFVFEGVLRKRFFEKGQFVDAAISSIIREE